LIYSG
jgi:hypothetical protein